MPIVDQDTYLGVEISNDCFWGAHIAKVLGKDKAYVVGKMDAILTDSHLDTRIKEIYPDECDSSRAKICISMGREREVRETVGNRTDDRS